MYPSRVYPKSFGRLGPVRTADRKLESDSMRCNSQGIGRRWLPLLLALFAAMMLAPDAIAQQTGPVSPRLEINLAAGVPQYIGNSGTTSTAPQSQWWYENTSNQTSYSSPTFVESTDTKATWTQVGLPYDANIPRTFLNQTSGGGEGSLTGNDNWYRLHFKVASKYAAQKFMLSLEGAHTGVQVYFNGTLISGISEVAADSPATHVVGFVPVIVELPVVADGATDNVIAIYVTRNNSKVFESIGWCEVFRFGQAMAGLFRNVYMYVTNPVHIPAKYSGECLFESGDLGNLRRYDVRESRSGHRPNRSIGRRGSANERRQRIRGHCEQCHIDHGDRG
jgi:beta-galactosidase